MFLPQQYLGRTVVTSWVTLRVYDMLAHFERRASNKITRSRRVRAVRGGVVVAEDGKELCSGSSEDQGNSASLVYTRPRGSSADPQLYWAARRVTCLAIHAGRRGPRKKLGQTVPLCKHDVASACIECFMWS